MEPQRYWQIDQVFAEVLERPPDERDDALAGICGDDEELKQAVRALLAAENMAGDFLRGPLDRSGLPWDVDDSPHGGEGEERAGPYRLLEVIGNGGAAVVYRAECEATGQPLAVKLSRRSGRKTETLRFLREWEVLARLDHPAIARCHDFGTTESGRFYIAMELVDGIPLDRYCDERRLGIEQRLELFHELCGAVGHIHQLGVVHRDLKPSNVMVTRDEKIKLLDFGIAKPCLSEAADFDPQPSTQTGLRLLTPGYASPEQLEGMKLMPSSDVYSLGVLLFELLTGESPYHIGTTWPLPIEIVEALVERPPLTLAEALWRLESRPDRAGEVRRTRGVTSVEELRRKLRTGSLEAILARALQKRPEKRYQTATALGKAIKRHLTKPLVAPVFEWGLTRSLESAAGTCRRMFELARAR